MGDRVRVLHLIDHIGAGGAQELILEILRSHSPAEFQHDVAYLFGRSNYRREYESCGARVMCLGTAPYRARSCLRPELAWRVFQLLRTQPYDVLHVHLYAALLYGPWIARVAGRRRTIVTMHAMREQLPPYVYPLCRLVEPAVDRFVGVLPQIGTDLLRAGIPCHKVDVITLGTRVEDFAAPGPPIGDLRGELGLPGDCLLLLSVGRFHRLKGQIYLIRAMPRILAEHPNTALVLVGEGEEEPKLRREVSRLALTSRVVFAGYRRDLRNLLLNADVVVVAPIRDALGVITIQALAAGRPVVASDVGALRNAVIPGQTGLLVPPGDPAALADAVLHLACCPERRRRLGEAGQRLAREQYTIGRFVSGYRALYTALNSAT